jgi:hypothetical protein
MDKNMVEVAYLKEVEALHFYHLRYLSCDKTVREYEHCRQRYLHHKKTVNHYKNMLREVD